MEKLGIIGGMGPAATARLFARIIRFTDAERDQDHLDITILNRPQTPDRTAYLLGEEGAPSFIPALEDAADELEEAGCTVLAIPCNTAHARLGNVEAVLDRGRFVDMPRETAAFAIGLGCRRVGILATDGSLRSGVYQRALLEAGVDAVVPGQAGQAAVMSLIYDDVKAGRIPEPGCLAAVCEELVEAGCDGIILGCTELSLLDAPRRMGGAGAGGAPGAPGVPVIDALDVLAWRCVQECGAPAHDLAAEFGARAASAPAPGEPPTAPAYATTTDKEA